MSDKILFKNIFFQRKPRQTAFHLKKNPRAESRRGTRRRAIADTPPGAAILQPL
ncbi:MAG: hypothetical protein R3197_19130 [Paracoccaceae bacterium]|nr:hypothetical protein [Paracoccaceae bacterium]